MVSKADMHALIAKEDVVRALTTVIDPEMHIDIHTLGLIYDIAIKEEGIVITMTLTTPLCPYADAIVTAVKETCAQFMLPVQVQVTFTPPWAPPAHLREILGV